MSKPDVDERIGFVRGFLLIAVPVLAGAVTGNLHGPTYGLLGFAVAFGVVLAATTVVVGLRRRYRG